MILNPSIIKTGNELSIITPDYSVYECGIVYDFILGLLGFIDVDNE